MGILGVKRTAATDAMTWHQRSGRRAAWLGLLGFGAAVVVVNGLLSAGNAWPTPWIRPTPLISAELAVLIVLISILAVDGRLARFARAVLASGLSVLLLVHYTDVTTAGLFGKPIDVYWDLAHLPNAAAMLAGRSLAVFSAIVLGFAAGLAGLFGLSWWAVGAIARPMVTSRRRLGLAALTGILVVAAAVGTPGFARPASLMIADQARRLSSSLTTAQTHSAGELASLGGSAGADVFVIFIESYAGRVFDDVDLAAGVGPAQERLGETLERTGWRAASAMVTAPTFGGASWLAHASLLSGRTIDNQRDHNAFLAAPPPTIVSSFRDAGYRTLALMPGLIDPWPEGESLGFDAIYARRDIDYLGPEFGFWRIPDQASLAWLVDVEITLPDRQPLFVMFPTVMSHIPFGPVPPYQPDWSRFAGTDPYDSLPEADGRGGFDYRSPYVRAVGYELDVIRGFLEHVAPRDALVVVLGDHPPPAIVVGPNTPWSVPVHVLARDRGRLQAFQEAGFVDGLRPATDPIGETADLTHLLLATDLDHGRQSD